MAKSPRIRGIPSKARAGGASGVSTIINVGIGAGVPGAGTGDMTKAVYDPTNANGDAFSMDKMAETATKKVLTAAERIIIGGISSPAINLQAGEIIAKDQICRQSLIDNKMYKVNATTKAGVEGLVMIATEALAADALGDFLQVTQNVEVGLTIGTYYASIVSGSKSTAPPVVPGQYARVIGYAPTTTLFLFRASDEFFAIV